MANTAADLRCRSMRSLMLIAALYFVTGQAFFTDAPLMELAYLCMSEATYPVGVVMPSA